MRDSKTVTLPKSEYDRMERRIKELETNIKKLNAVHEDYLSGKVAVYHYREYAIGYRTSLTVEILEGTEEFEQLFRKLYGIKKGDKNTSKSLANQLTNMKQLLRDINMQAVQASWGTRSSALKAIKQMIKESNNE